MKRWNRSRGNKVPKYGKHKKWENSYQKMKRFPEERHTQTQGNSFEIF